MTTPSSASSLAMAPAIARRYSFVRRLSNRNRAQRRTATLKEAIVDDQRVQRAIELAVFGGELGRRQFIARVGASTAAAALASVFPMGVATAIAQEKVGPLEKK